MSIIRDRFSRWRAFVDGTRIRLVGLAIVTLFVGIGVAAGVAYVSGESAPSHAEAIPSEVAGVQSTGSNGTTGNGTTGNGTTTLTTDGTPSILEIRSTTGDAVTYRFVVDGTVENSSLSALGVAADADDTITTHDNGTTTVVGSTGSDGGDAFLVNGTIAASAVGDGGAILVLLSKNVTDQFAGGIGDGQLDGDDGPDDGDDGPDDGDDGPDDGDDGPDDGDDQTGGDDQAGPDGEAAFQEIDACTVVDEPGRYRLTGGVGSGNWTATNFAGTATEACLLVNASDVTIEGDGHAVGNDESGTDAVGIYVASDGVASESPSNVTVRNVHVRNWSTGVRVGYHMGDGVGSDVRLNGVTAVDNGFGILLNGADDSAVVDANVSRNDRGLHLLELTDARISDVVARGNENSGISLGQGAVRTDVADVTVTNNGGAGIRLGRTAVIDNRIAGSLVSDNGGVGIDVYGDTRNNSIVDTEVVSNGDAGIRIGRSPGTSGVSVTDSTIRSNGAGGIVFVTDAERSSLSNVTVADHEGPALRTDDGTLDASALRIDAVASFDFVDEGVTLATIGRDELPALPEEVRPLRDAVDVTGIANSVEGTFAVDDDGNATAVQLWRHDGDEWTRVANASADGGSDDIADELDEDGVYVLVDNGTANGTEPNGTEPSIEFLNCTAARVSGDYAYVAVGEEMNRYNGVESHSYQEWDTPDLEIFTGNVIDVATLDDGDSLNGSLLYDVNLFDEDIQLITRETNPQLAECRDRVKPRVDFEVASVESTGDPGVLTVTFSYTNHHDVTLVNVGDQELRGDAEPRPDGLPDEFEPGTHSFSVEWTPGSPDDRLAWVIDTSRWVGLPNSTVVETEPASTYGDPPPIESPSPTPEPTDGPTPSPEPDTPTAEPDTPTPTAEPDTPDTDTPEPETPSPVPSPTPDPDAPTPTP